MLIAALVVLIAACLLLEGFFSGSETAIISADRVSLRARARRGDARAMVAQELLERSERLLSTTLVGTNLAVVTGTSLATLAVGRWVGAEWESVVTTAVMSPLILVFGEILPKSLGRANALGMTLRVARALRFAQRLMAPVVVGVGWVADTVLRPLGRGGGAGSPYVSREGLKALAEVGAEQGALLSEEKRMMHSVLELHERPVETVMVPLVEMVALPLDATLADLETATARSGFSRLPVYEGRVDNVVGIVRVVDALKEELAPDAPVGPLVHRDVAYVPETKPVGELLAELRYSLAPMAIVVEEHGGVVGLVTLEDLVEEVIGHIRDEREGEDLLRLEARSFDCDGAMEVDELVRLTGLPVRKEGFETVGGLLMKLTGRIPQRGETVAFGPYRVEVLEATARQVRRVRFRLR